MADDPMIFLQGLVLLAGLGALGFALTATHLLRKVGAWAAGQGAILLFGVLSLSRYHGQWNPFLLTLLVVTAFASICSFLLMLVLALGVLKRQGSFDGVQAEKR